MLAKRIIPCLDVKDGRTVKGINFVGIRDAGDAVELAAKYAADGADELVLLDITATNERRKTLTDLVARVAEAINIPFTVGGGIADVNDIGRLLEAGADKISINTAAVRNPQLIAEAAQNFGSQCVVVAIDAAGFGKNWRAFLNGGRLPTELDALDWAVHAEHLGAGELLITSINADGTRRGFDVNLVRAAGTSTRLPIIASGGAGSIADFAEVFVNGDADAALAASVFHDGEISIADLKLSLRESGVEVRI